MIKDKYDPSIIEQKWPRKRLTSRSRGPSSRGKQIESYKPSEIENKWQVTWERNSIYSPDLDRAKKPYYQLMMFPYPSAEGMHVGNMYAFTGSDIHGRFKRMQGYDVFEPFGLDGFGIHSENYAIKVGRHPKEQAKKSEENFYRQVRASGHGFDWTRLLQTYDPNYYKWTQWLFIQLFKAGLAYRKKAPVNFCPSCKTVLADEQVIDTKCERCGSVVEKRELEQWFFRITRYADRLLNNIKKLNWPAKVTIAQRNWIGKKEGININYQVEGSDEKIVCFTTRPDTNFGATFIVIGPEHPFVALLLNSKIKEIQKYLEIAQNKTEQERIGEGRKKTGVFTGFYAINNLNGKRLPIWISDFVLGNVGTGAVVGVPGHDLRDFEFATTFNLPIIRVVVGKDGDTSAITKAQQVQEEEGTMINSEFLNGLDIHEATNKVMDYLEGKGWGKRITTYHLRDWLISRQRYWGPPIPMIYCEKCEWQPVTEEDLPVLLPDVKDWKPLGIGKSPLANVESFVKTKCPNCKGSARRETDVSDTFLDSSWYFFRYVSTESRNEPFSKDRVKKWLPANIYTGGAEHSVLHLLYARFITMVLSDLGLIDFEEPFPWFYAHGLLISGGAKMSKSKGNVIVPDEYIKKYGADALRTYLMFIGPFNMGGDFSDSGIEGVHRFLKRVWTLAVQSAKFKVQSYHQEKRIMHRTIKKVTEDIERLHYNTAIAALMEFYNFLVKQKTVSKEAIEVFLKLLAPFAPYMTEELWSRLQTTDYSLRKTSAVDSRQLTVGWSIHTQPWPTYDQKYIEEAMQTVVVQVNGKMRAEIQVQSLTLRLPSIQLRTSRSGQELKVKSYVEEEAKKQENVKKHLDQKKIQKVIYVPGKVINFVVT